ncbi:hypothetical protein C7S15_3363 [Burkholderia cepacia]|nr:hypothetical protein [Burkholderia cepacia]
MRDVPRAAVVSHGGLHRCLGSAGARRAPVRISQAWSFRIGMSNILFVAY